MNYILDHPAELRMLVGQHLYITLVTLAIAIAIAVPLSLGLERVRWMQGPILGLLGVVYTIPSLALIILLVPLLGLNARSAIAATILYSQAILVRNLVAGLEAISPAVVDAARGMGMNRWQLWWRIQMPLVLPVFLAGVRLSAVVTVAIATIGAKFGAGGLGVLLFDGIAQTGRYDKIWAGAIAVMGLAFAINSAALALEAMANPLLRQRWRHRFSSVKGRILR